MTQANPPEDRQNPSKQSTSLKKVLDIQKKRSVFGRAYNYINDNFMVRSPLQSFLFRHR